MFTDRCPCTYFVNGVGVLHTTINQHSFCLSLQGVPLPNCTLHICVWVVHPEPLQESGWRTDGDIKKTLLQLTFRNMNEHVHTHAHTWFYFHERTHQDRWVSFLRRNMHIVTDQEGEMQQHTYRATFVLCGASTWELQACTPPDKTHKYKISCMMEHWSRCGFSDFNYWCYHKCKFWQM